MRSPPPLEQARHWWKGRTDAARYVVSPDEAPSAAVARVLREEGLVLDVAGRRAWILTPGKLVDARAVFLANYWAVLALVLKRYTPAAIAGVAAELHNDPLARQLEQLVRRVSHRTTSPSRTGVGTRLAVPQVLRQAARGSGSPWLDEQAMRLARHDAEITALVGKALTRLP